MDGLFPLNIFPSGALSSSVITTVWVGIFVIVMLNLRFGTTLSGLVVPGYLVPLIILRPMSASVIVFEAITTYLVAKVLAEKIPKMLSYSEVFGRDRFFALILISVIVRLIFDGFLLPILGDYLVEQGIEYDYRNNLHSFGLIIVALIANQMWNGGIRLGLSSLFVYISIAYVIVRFILMEYTNFNISTMSYMYEDLASSILASPKAYIILLTSAFIASRMNIKYGWEFNGILIPSLLALQWYQPEKLVVTIVEAIIIYLIATLILKLETFKKLHIEGPRQILLFFNISFIYKLLLGFFLIEFYPNVKVSDYYAFGYLLSTLLAIKMYQKDIAILMARATIQTSLTAVIAASIIGFLLTYAVGDSDTKLSIESDYAQYSKIPNIRENFNIHLGTLRSKLYSSEQSTLSGQANPVELDDVKRLFALVKVYLDTPTPIVTQHILKISQDLSFNIYHLNQRYLIVEDNQPERGWGIYILNTNTESKLIIEVPAPLDEPQAIDAATSLYVTTLAKGLGIAGKKRKQSADGTSDTLKNSQTVFQVFHQTFALQNTLQVRQYTQSSGRRLLGIKSQNLTDTLNIKENQLWVKKTLPDDLNVNAMDSMIKNLDIKWQYAPLENRQQEASIRGFTELFLSPSGVKDILSYSETGSIFSEKIQTQRIDGYLLNWIKANKNIIASKGSNAYEPAKLYELLFFDQNVITPVLNLLSRDLAKGWKNNVALEMQRINNLAHAINYELIRYHHQSSGDDFLILQEKQNNQIRHWGTFVFRVGDATPYLIEVSRPLSEINTLEFGTGLFEKLKAKALLISGTHPYANFDGTSNLLHTANKINLFNLVHQVVLREIGQTKMMTIQMRAFSNKDDTPDLATDALIAELGVSNQQNTELTTPLEKVLNDFGLNHQYVVGSKNDRGYEVSWNAQARYSPMTHNKPFYVIWLSPRVRSTYQDQAENRQQMTKFLTLGVATQTVDLAQWVSQSNTLTRTAPNVNYQHLNRYFKNQNVTHLKDFLSSHEQFVFNRFVDMNTHQAYLAITLKNGALVALINLQTHSLKRQFMDASAPPTLIEAQGFIDERSRWLLRSNQL